MLKLCDSSIFEKFKIMSFLLNIAWKYVEIVTLVLIISIDFCVRVHHFNIISSNNSTEWPHEVKHMLMPITGNYIQEPISKFSYNLIFSHINLDKHFLANLITFTYTFISIPAIWLLSRVERKYILYRQLGCIIFQARNIMDYLDGAVIRHGKTKTYTQTGYIVDNGQLVDGIANALSAMCFFIGTFLYILRKYTKTTNSPDNFEADEVNDYNKLTNEFNRKYDRSTLVVLILLFLIYFIIASLGWDIVLGVYTKEVIYNQVYVTFFSLLTSNYTQYF